MSDAKTYDNTKELVEKIEQDVLVMLDDAKRFVFKHNKAAAKRARKQTVAIEKLFKQFRKLSINESKQISRVDNT